MKLQSKIFIPVIASLIVLGGSMYWLNRQILKETFNSEIQNVLNEKEKSFDKLTKNRMSFVSQYANILANSSTIRSAFVGYDQSRDFDAVWPVLNAEIDRIRYSGNRSKIRVPEVSCIVPPGVLLYNSKSGNKGDNLIYKKKTIREVFNNKKSVVGIEIGEDGLGLKAVYPVKIKSKFFGALEVSYPLVKIIEELQPEEDEAYALIIKKEFSNKITNLEAVKKLENFLKEDIVIRQTVEFDLAAFDLVYDPTTSEKQIDFGEEYNHMVLPIKNFDNEIIGSLVYQMSRNSFLNMMNASSYSLFFIGIIIFVISSVILFVVMNKVVVNPIKKVTNALSNLSLGIISKEVEEKGKDEIAKMRSALNVVNEGMQKMSEFAIEIGNEVYDSEFNALSEDDELGNTLIQVRDKLKGAAEQELLQNKTEEQRTWVVEGLSDFSTLLQDNEIEIDEFTYAILSKLIAYLDVNQGSIFLLSGDEETLVLSSSYAYDRRKYTEKEIKLGEGLLGNTAIEGQMTYLTDIPEDHVSITSGLGDASPTSLLIMPMFSDNKLMGVFELAGFRNLEDFELEFCEKVAENIALAISRQQINQRTQEFLEQSRQQSEELSAQEEEMRQNLEEMQATQEEMSRKDAETTGIVNALNASTLVVEFDLEGNITNINDRILDLFGGITKNEIIGANHRDFYESSDNSEEESTLLWDALRRKETVSRKAKVTSPSGSAFWLNETYSPVLDPDGDIVRILNISFNITEEVINEQQIAQQNEEMMAQEEEMRQNLEEMAAQEEEMLLNFEEMQATQEELAKREAESNAIINTVKVTVLLAEFSTDKIVTDINDKFVGLFGIQKDEMVGQSHEYFSQFSNNASKYDRLWKKVLKGEIVNMMSDFVINGKIYKIEETYTPVVLDDDSISKVINVSVLRA